MWSGKYLRWSQKGLKFRRLNIKTIRFMTRSSYVGAYLEGSDEDVVLAEIAVDENVMEIIKRFATTLQVANVGDTSMMFVRREGV
jgi:hypothetical protein